MLEFQIRRVSDRTTAANGREVTKLSRPSRRTVFFAKVAPHFMFETEMKPGTIPPGFNE